MTGFLVTVGLAFLFLFYLILESILHVRKINRIPLRITVSGTRGKTSIVRSLASVLRTHGMTVLAKTTGSEACYILPDGSTQKIHRKGLITILEQKKLVAKAVTMNVNCMITEIMSIHPDNHYIETQKLIRPGITILTNFRADHTDVVGTSTRELAALFERDIYPKSRVVIPQEEVNEFITNSIRIKQSEIITAPTGICKEINFGSSTYRHHIPVNLDAVVTTARYLGIPDRNILKGIQNTELDIGQLEIFPFHLDNRKIWFINTFAANDPISTVYLIRKTREILDPEISSSPGTFAEPQTIGLIALRSDRGERSQQWMNFLKSESRAPFDRLYVSGIHSHLFAKKLPDCEILRSKNPEKITRQIIDSTHGDLLVFGIANIHGVGNQLLSYWESNAHPNSKPDNRSA
jgi:gamma-polyglutamate synthase